MSAFVSLETPTSIVLPPPGGGEGRERKQRGRDIREGREAPFYPPNCFPQLKNSMCIYEVGELWTYRNNSLCTGNGGGGEVAGLDHKHNTIQ